QAPPRPPLFPYTTLFRSGNDPGQWLVEHPLVRMVSLTGSTGTGKKIMRTASETLKRVHLELGGKAPFIVLDDADASLVATKAARSEEHTSELQSPDHLVC